MSRRSCRSSSVYLSLGRPPRDKLRQYSDTLRLPLTIDGSIVTGEALGAAIPFALALARILAGADAANRVKSAIVYQ